MKTKYILIGFDGKTLHAERDFGECTIQELSLLLIGLEEVKRDILDKFREDYPKEYIVTDDKDEPPQ